MFERARPVVVQFHRVAVIRADERTARELRITGVPMFPHEIKGVARIREVAEVLFG